MHSTLVPSCIISNQGFDKDVRLHDTMGDVSTLAANLDAAGSARHRTKGECVPEGHAEIACCLAEQRAQEEDITRNRSNSPGQCQPARQDKQARAYGREVTYRNRALSSLSGRKWAAADYEPPDPESVGRCSSSSSSGFPCVPEDSHWSAETEPGSTLPALWPRAPRSGALAAFPRRRLGVRAFSPPLVLPEMEAAAARRLNGRRSLQVDSRASGPHGDRERRSLGGHCCVHAVATNTTCVPNPDHCSASSSRTLRPRLPRCS